PAPAGFVFDWHLRPGAFSRLAPPWQRVELIDPGEGVREGSRAVVALRKGPFVKRWVAEHFGVVAGREFRDRQVSGPFAAFEHRHRMIPEGTGRSILEDQIEYTLPL